MFLRIFYWALIVISLGSFVYGTSYFNQRIDWFPGNIDVTLKNLQSLGVIGDYFSGVFSPIAALLGFAGILISVDITAAQFKKQNEETTFHNLVSLHMARVGSVEIEKRDLHQNRGDEFEPQEDISGLPSFKFLIKKYNQYFTKELVLHAKRIMANRPESIIDARFSFLGERLIKARLIKIEDDVFIPDEESRKKAVDLIRSRRDKWEFIKDLFSNCSDTHDDLFLMGLSDLFSAEISVRKHIFANSFDHLYSNYGSSFGHYFRNMKQVMDFIASSKSKERHRKLYRAQLSRYEIALLACNCLSTYSTTNFNTRVIELNLLKGLYPMDLRFNPTIDSIYLHIKERNLVTKESNIS